MYGGDALLGDRLANPTWSVWPIHPHRGYSPVVSVGSFLLLLDNAGFGVVCVVHWFVSSIGFDNPDIDSTRINVKQKNTLNPKKKWLTD